MGTPQSILTRFVGGPLHNQLVEVPANLAVARVQKAREESHYYHRVKFLTGYRCDEEQATAIEFVHESLMGKNGPLPGVGAAPIFPRLPPASLNRFRYRLAKLKR